MKRLLLAVLVVVGVALLGVGAYGAFGTTSTVAGPTPTSSFCRIVTQGITPLNLTQLATLSYYSPDPAIRLLSTQILDTTEHLTTGLPIHEDVVLIALGESSSARETAVDRWVTRHCERKQT